MKALLVAASLIALAVPASAQPDHGAHRLGTVVFETSCNAEAQAHVDRAAAWLHSFEYEEAEKAFLEASAADPDCAMAQWGVAMSNYHPLWAPPTAAEMAKGKAAAERAAGLGAPTARERGYIDAIGEFYRDAGARDHLARTLAYTAAMERLHRANPADDEAATFYALALIAAGTTDTDPDFAREKEAAEILNGVLARQPNHPGVAHYLIHGYDYPALAQLALTAARSYATIAPASAHAQHMPSHIFTRLGLWQEGIRSNLGAESAAKDYARRHGMPGAWDEQLHAMDYLAYSYLQAGQDEKAREVLDALGRIERVDPPNFKVAYAFSAIPARFALERRRWDEAAALALPANAAGVVDWTRFPWAEAHIHFARAVGAARGGDAALARSEVDALNAIRKSLTARQGEYDWGTQVDILRQVASGWLAAAEGRDGDALALMRSAAELDDVTEKHPVTPGSILPAREQLGELLLDLGRPAEAFKEFEASLRRAPGRLAGLRGAAQAARLSGRAGDAAAYYGQLRALCESGCNRPEFAEATEFLSAQR